MHSNLWIEVEKWLWTSQAWPAGGLGARPPGPGFGGGDCGGAKHLQKKFFKKLKT